MKRVREEVNGLPKTTAGLVAASFALPSDVAPFRMRNEYSTEKTALFHVFEEHQAFKGSASANEQLDANTHCEFIFQDPLRNRITYQRNPGNVVWSYSWCFGRTTAGNDNTSQTVLSNQDEWLQPTHCNSTGAFIPHGPVLFSNIDNGIYGVWVDATTVAGSVTNITVTLSPTPAATGGSVVFYRWTNGNWTEAAGLTITNTQATYVHTPTSSAYFAVRVRNAVASEAVSVVSSGNCGCWGHWPAAYILTNGNSIESIRSLGHSILVKNFTNDLNKDGDITAVQPGKNRPWLSFVGTSSTTDVFANVRDYAGAENTRPLAKGLYGFIKPTEEDDLRLRESFVIMNRSTGTNTDTVWTSTNSPIINTAYLIVVFTTSNALAQNICVRTDYSAEFETGNQFFNIDKPRAEPAEWRDGMEALASFQQFYENPTHWKKILQTIGSIASVGGRIMSLFGPKGSAVGVPISMGGDILRGI